MLWQIRGVSAIPFALHRIEPLRLIKIEHSADICMEHVQQFFMSPSMMLRTGCISMSVVGIYNFPFTRKLLFNNHTLVTRDSGWPRIMASIVNLEIVIHQRQHASLATSMIISKDKS